MRLFANSRKRLSTQRGFTMVEIALCLAVVGFAMVVIMGVIPLGGLVQKENRETVLCQMDGNYLLQAISEGAQGYDDLGLYVDEILFYSRPNAEPRKIENNAGGVEWGTREIIGLLSAPEFLLTRSNVWVPNSLNNMEVFGVSNTNLICKIKMRSMNGSAADKNMDNRDFAMSYLAEVKVLPLTTNYHNMYQVDSNSGIREGMLKDRSLNQSAWQVSVILNWPVVPAGTDEYKAGPNQQVFRTIISGTMNTVEKTMEMGPLGTRNMILWYFDKGNFSLTNSTVFYDNLLL